LEYKYSYRKRLGKDVRLCAVIEREPRRSVEWMGGFLSYLNIGLIWKNDADSRMNCTTFTMELLGDVIPKIRKTDFSSE
jgi:hypothetical protein